MSLIPVSMESNFNYALDPIVQAIARLKIQPNAISTIGCISNLLAGAFLFNGQFLIAGMMILFAGVLDFADGKLARMTNQATIYGAVYDATLDRFGELAIFTGIGAFLIAHNMYVITLIAVIACSGSMLISYVRARAEAHQVSCNVGILRKADRVLLLGIGSTMNFMSAYAEPSLRQAGMMLNIPYAPFPVPLTLVLVAIAILSPVTVVQRLIHIQMNRGE